MMGVILVAITPPTFLYSLIGVLPDLKVLYFSHLVLNN